MRAPSIDSVGVVEKNLSFAVADSARCHRTPDESVELGLFGWPPTFETFDPLLEVHAYVRGRPRQRESLESTPPTLGSDGGTVSVWRGEPKCGPSVGAAARPG
jgi:hypothetical protein